MNGRCPASPWHRGLRRRDERAGVEQLRLPDADPAGVDLGLPAG